MQLQDCSQPSSTVFVNREKEYLTDIHSRSAFQPMMYQTAAGQDHLANNHHETIEQFLLRECASGQRVDLLTEAVQLQYGHRMTPDDLFMTYRIAFWKTRSWEESDTSLMEQIVREEIRGFWNRVARGVSLSPPVSS